MNVGQSEFSEVAELPNHMTIVFFTKKKDNFKSILLDTVPLNYSIKRGRHYRSPSCHSDTHSSVSSSLWITTINSSKDLEFVKNEYIKLWIEDQASQKEMKNLKAKRIELKMKQKKLKAELNDEKMKNQKLEEAAFNDRKEKAELKKKVSNLEQSAQNTQRTLQNQTRELNLYSTVSPSTEAST